MGEPVVDPKVEPKVEELDIKETLGEISKRLDKFDGRFEGLTAAQSAPVVPAPVEQGPTVQDQIAEINKDIVAVTQEYDQAIKDGNPTGEILLKRDELLEKRTTLNLTSHFDEKMAAGIGAIDALTSKAAEGDMPHLKIPEVKKAYDDMIATVPQAQRMNLEVRKGVYNLVVGQNVETIVKTTTEAALRQDPDPTQTPSGGTGRDVDVDGDDAIPAPEDMLSAGALASIAGQGMSVDQYYQKRHGCSWEEYYKENKEFF
jgi:hypothetical protein